MALLKDLTVFGATRLVLDTFANHIWANGYHHNDHDNDDAVLLAGGGWRSINTLLGSGFWADKPIQTIGSNDTTPRFARISLGTTIDSSYSINSAGSIKVADGHHIRIGAAGASGTNNKANYISAGPGYSSGSGRYGVKVLACDQADCQSGLGQDVVTPTGWTNSYNFSLISGNSSADLGYISFASHKVNSTTYRYLGGFRDNAGTVTFQVIGAINSSGFHHTSHNNDDGVLLAGGGWETLANLSSTHNHDTRYVKLDPGAAEQTIKSSIGTLSEGVINLWRNSGDHYTFLGFSNGTTKKYLGGIGFKSQSDHNFYRKDSTTTNYYMIADASNITSKDATIDSSLTEIATIAGVSIKAKVNPQYTTHMYVGDVDTSTNNEITNPYLKLFDDNTLRNQYQLKGDGIVNVDSDSSGNVTISAIDKLPKAVISRGTTATTTAGEVYGIVGSATSGARIPTRWFVNLDNGVTELTDGMIISFRMPTAGIATVGECLTIDNNQDHFHQLVLNTNSILTTHFGINSVLTVQYDATITFGMYGKYNSSTGTYVHNSNSTRTVAGVWRVLSLYDSGNTDVRYQQTIYYNQRKVISNGALRRYTLCMMNKDGEITSLTLTDNGYGSTTKTMYAGYLDPRKVYYWNTTTNVAGGSNSNSGNVLLTHNGDLIDYRYTFNCSTTLVGKKCLYIVGTIDNNGFKLDPTQPWSCTLPTTEDGKVYIYVGMIYDTYRGTLEENNTIYLYKNGEIIEYNGNYSFVSQNENDTYYPLVFTNADSTTGYKDLYKSYDYLLWNPDLCALSAGKNTDFGEDDNYDLNNKYMYSFGYNNFVTGYGVFAAGHKVSAIGDGAHAVGEHTIAVAHSHAEGWYSKALNDYSHAEGYCTTAKGEKSHAEGHYSITTKTAAHAEGFYTFAGGFHTHAEGFYTNALGGSSHAEGDHTISFGVQSHAEGYNTLAQGISAHAEGYIEPHPLRDNSSKFIYINGPINNNTKEYHIINENNVNYISSVEDDQYYIIEYNNSKIILKIKKYSSNSIKLYYENNALFEDIIDQTDNQTDNGKIYEIQYGALGDYSHSEGYNTKANGTYSHAEGNRTIAGTTAHAEGLGTSASGMHSHAEGHNTIASGEDSHAEGDGTESSGVNSHAEGFETTAGGLSTHAEGYHTSASGMHSHAEGYNTLASGGDSHAEGEGSQAIGGNSHAEGYHTITEGTHSHAEGHNSMALGNDSHSEGDHTLSMGPQSHTEGYNTFAKGVSAHAEGYNVSTELKNGGYLIYINGPINSSNEYSITDEYDNNCINYIIHDQQYIIDYNNSKVILKILKNNDRIKLYDKNDELFDGTLYNAQIYEIKYGALGDYSHTEGENTKANGMHSHAEGYNTIASGPCSHAEGASTEAIGQYSHAQGLGTITTNEHEFACGQYNKSNPGTRFSVGIGNYNANVNDFIRKNIFEILTQSAHDNVNRLYGGVVKIGTEYEDFVPDEGDDESINYQTRLYLGGCMRITGAYDYFNEANATQGSKRLIYFGDGNRVYLGEYFNDRYVNSADYEFNTDILELYGNDGIYLHENVGINTLSSSNYTLKVNGDQLLENGNLYINTGDTDKFIHFRYNSNNYAGGSWRLISRGTGTGDANYFDIETGGSAPSTTTWSRVIRLTMDNRRVGINTDTVEKTLDVNGIAQIYQRGNDNTAFKNLLLIKQQNSTEPAADAWAATNPSFGIGFNRYYTSGSSPYGETTCAGIYATVSSSWRGGLVFRTKNNTTQSGTHDVTALRLTPSGITYANTILPFSTNNKNLGSTSLRWAKLYIGTADSYGSDTQPVYWNAGVPKATTHTLSASVKAGSANRMAWYDTSTSISAAASIYVSETVLAINSTAAPANSGNFQVKGTSTMQTILAEATNTYDLGSTSLRFKSTYNIDEYIGTTSGDQCHLNFDSTNKCLRFTFD